MAQYLEPSRVAGVEIHINPGTEGVPLGTEAQARAIMEALRAEIGDLEIDIYRNPGRDGAGLFGFIFGSIEVEVPGLPLDQVRFTYESGLNPFDFPRLYVDGDSWLWESAVKTLRYLVGDVIVKRNKSNDVEINLGADLAALYDEITKHPEMKLRYVSSLPNLLGMLRSIPDQKYYREPPRNGFGPTCPGLTAQEIRDLIYCCKADLRQNGIEVPR